MKKILFLGLLSAGVFMTASAQNYPDRDVYQNDPYYDNQSSYPDDQYYDQTYRDDQYYYYPDANVYYYPSTRNYIYYDRNRWCTSPRIPAYLNLNIGGRRFSITFGSGNIWRYNDQHRSMYRNYGYNRGPVIIQRDVYRNGPVYRNNNYGRNWGRYGHNDRGRRSRY